MKNTLKWVMYGGLFVLPFVPFLVFSSFFFPFITSKAFAFRIIVEVVFAAWVVLALIDKEYRPKKSLIVYSLLSFLTIIGLANILGAAPVKSFWSNFERMEGYVTLLHLGALFLATSSFFKEADWRRWWNTSLVASGLMVGYGLLQLLGALTINQGGARVDGTLGNASYLAVYMLFHFFLAVLFIWRSHRNSAMRWVYGILAFSHLFIIYHTATRGAILGVLGGLFILALLNVRNKQDSGLRKGSIATLVGLTVLVGGFWLMKDTSLVQGSPVLARFAEISTTELQSGGRSYVWPMAIEGIKERPLLGWGQENFNYVFQEHYSPEMHKLEPWFDRAHNIFLDWGVAGGVLGLLAYLSLYAALLYLVWKGEGESMSYAEKSIITALVSAYFFHNLFVFDNLASYILFFSLLAYIHTRATADRDVVFARHQDDTLVRVAAPVVVVCLVFTLYFVNFKPMSVNASLIEALMGLQLNQPAVAAENFKAAYGRTALGRLEVVEQTTARSFSILTSSELSDIEKNEYFTYTMGIAEELARDYDNDARIQLVTGSYLAKTGQYASAEKYLRKAEELMPNKQAIYFDLGALYLNSGQEEQALAEFKKAYDMAPEYDEAVSLYLIAAIFSGERELEERLVSELDERTFVFDSRILSSYQQTGRVSAVREMLEMRIELDPENAERYQNQLEELE